MDVVERLLWIFSPLLVPLVILSSLALSDRKGEAKAIGWHGQRWCD